MCSQFKDTIASIPSLLSRVFPDHMWIGLGRVFLFNRWMLSWEEPGYSPPRTDEKLFRGEIAHSCSTHLSL